MLEFCKRIADPVHGSIGITKVELDLINTKSFARLRDVKQLGMAYYVYPGADYSRFAHSVGVCHTTGLILNQLRTVESSINDNEVQRYRLAGLLHDIGHYPFSHAMEDAIQNYFSEKLTKRVGGGDDPGDSQSESFLMHEELGAEVLEHDEEVKNVLNEFGYDGDEISSIFNRNRPPKYANLVSSDLDADRIDYLLRTALHTGLPYGSVDLDYLIANLMVDENSRICIKPRALRTADHFLLCRLFDYQQVSFHKTVAALELVLKDVIVEALKRDIVTASKQSILDRISDGTWADFDDTELVNQLRELRAQEGEPDLHLRLDALFGRNPPRMIYAKEFFKVDGEENYEQALSLIGSCRRELAREVSLNENRFYIWKKALSLTKVGGTVAASSIGSEKVSEKLEQAVRVASKTGSKPIAEHESSVMKLLADAKLYTIRLYVLLGEEEKELRRVLERKVRDFMGGEDS
ncbi:MAG TPA: hypothetical protein DDW52_16515 [Planctomycetaceae bacterium]|nr:hypothetical protein [Planctomycetaceae bacterium]